MADVIGWENGPDGVVTLTIDDPEQRVNTLNASFVESFARTIDRLEKERDEIQGVILRSGKDSFLAGGDLKRLIEVEPADRGAFVADLQQRKSRMRRLETLGRPVVVVLTGPALGGGFELALSCHRRVAVRNARTAVGLPEITLGLLPGGGGITRTVRLLGLDAALEPVLLSGKSFSAEEAHELGLVDELADSEADAIQRARTWIRANPHATQPWDREDPAVACADSPVSTTRASSEIVRIASLAASGNFDEAQRAESEALGELVVSTAAKRTIQVTFFDTTRLRGRLRNIDLASAPPVQLRLCDEQAAELVSHSKLATFVIGADRPVADGHCQIRAVGRRPGADLAPTEIRVHADRYTAGGIVIEYREANKDVLGAVAQLVRAGALAIPVTGPSFADTVIAAAPDDDNVALARAAVDCRDDGLLAYPEDLAVASVRLLGLPALTGGAEQLLVDRAGAPK